MYKYFFVDLFIRDNMWLNDFKIRKKIIISSRVELSQFEFKYELI